jgi:hypothetical protein
MKNDRLKNTHRRIWKWMWLLRRVLMEFCSKSCRRGYECENWTIWDVSTAEVEPKVFLQKHCANCRRLKKIPISKNG